MVARIRQKPFDPLAAEIQNCVLQIASLVEELKELESTRTKAISELELAHQNLESRTTHLGNRASAIRRDLGRALLENEPGESMAPEVRQAKKAADTVDKLLIYAALGSKNRSGLTGQFPYRSVSIFSIFFMVLIGWSCFGNHGLHKSSAISSINSESRSRLSTCGEIGYRRC